jgi:hypothetical protein
LSALDLDVEQRGGERLAMRVQRQRARDAAGQRIVHHEVHGRQMRQRIARDLAAHDTLVMRAHALGSQHSHNLPRTAGTA